MGTDYIPERDHRAAVWMKLFAQELVASPSAYRATTDEASQIDDAVTAFRTANATAWAKGTRTRLAVLSKNETRKAAEQLIRPTAQRIRIDPTITPDLKIAIGLRPGTPRRRRVGPPGSVPVLAMAGQLSGVVDVKVTDSLTHRAARPDGTIGYELYERIVPAGMGDGDDQPWQFAGTYTSTPIRYQPSAQQPGDQVWLMARWVTRRGEVGTFGNAKGLSVGNVMLKVGAAQRTMDRQAA
jgi:hypothetical protein